MLRGAIVGFGNVALHGHVPGWRERSDVEIVAVTDARPDRRPACTSALPDARWYELVDALFDDPRLDFVDICTPPSSHAALVRQALQHRLHVLCEKPLVHSAEDCAWLADLAEKTGRVLHTVHNWHHAPMAHRTWELIRDGAIGTVRHVSWETRRTRPATAVGEDGGNWRVDPTVAGGGVLSDHGWHVFYLVNRWVGAAPTGVRARLERRRHLSLAVEDTATVEIVYPAATADILLTWADDVRENRAAVVGTRGRLELRDDTIVLRDDAGREAQWRCPPALSDGSHHPDWFRHVAGEFVAEVTNGSRKRENLAEASLCVALESAARESSRRGGSLLPVAVSA